MCSDWCTVALVRSADFVSMVSNVELAVPQSPLPEEPESGECRWPDQKEALVRVAAATAVDQEATVAESFVVEWSLERRRLSGRRIRIRLDPVRDADADRAPVARERIAARTIAGVVTPDSQ